jgi:hypothetical protein
MSAYESAADEAYYKELYRVARYHTERRYVVNVGSRNRRFATLEAATSFCSATFARCGIVLSIVEA